MKSGVYQITTPSGKRYIGSAVDLKSRWRVHKHHLRMGTHCNALLQAAWNKYGNDISFEVLLFCSRENVVFYEQLSLDALQPELNVAKFAGNTLGYKHTEETKSKFHLRKKAGPVSEEGKAARIAAIKAWVMSEQHREVIRSIKSKAVRCAETGIEYSSARKAAAWVVQVTGNEKARGINIGYSANGRMKKAYGFTWSWV